MRKLTCALLVVGAMLVGIPAVASAQGFNPITPTKANETITLTGEEMTIQQVVDIARHGAKVELSDQHRQRTSEAYELLLEAPRQDIPVYWFSRAAGSGRETVIFEGDPLSEENRALLEERQLEAFRGGAERGIGPEVADEEIIRAMMAVRANNISHEAVTPGVPQKLVQFLNQRITPVVQSGGSPGEGDLPQMGNVAGAMVGVGEVHHQGQRTPARTALAQAGLQLLEPFAADQAGLISTNAFTDGQTALLVHDAKELLDWGDLTFTMSMNGLNSSVTPLTAVPQNHRPLPYANWQSQRLLTLLGDSYLFDFEGIDDQARTRIIQDPLSYRDYNQRNGAAWSAWDQLHSTLMIQINSSDHNPAVVPGVSPDDSPELDTPWLRRYYVEPAENTEGGFVLSNSNFNNTQLNNDKQSFVMALAESMAATAQRVLRLEDTFFTVISPSDVLSEEELSMAPPRGGSYNISALIAEIQSLANPIPAQGNALVRQVEDVEGFGAQKVAKARLAVDAALRLVGQELLSASYWMNVRHAQDPERSFGDAATAGWEAFRAVIPWQMDPDQRPQTPPGNLTYSFVRGNPAAQFMGDAAAGPDVRDDGPPAEDGDEETDPPSDDEVQDNTDDAADEEGVPQRKARGHVKRLRGEARGVERQVRKLRRQARRGGSHANRGRGARSRR